MPKGLESARKSSDQPGVRITDQEHNRLQILKLLRVAEPLARTELAARSGLTGGTITAIVGDLVARGLVIEEKMPAKRGRPRVNLRLNPDAAYVAGVQLSYGRLIVEIVNLKGESIHSFEAPPRHTGRLADLADEMADAIEQAIAASGVARSAIVRVGIGLPAIVDSVQGLILHFETFDPGPFAFAAPIAARLGIPVTIDNDLNALAHAEHWFGTSAGLDDFTLIIVELAVGSTRYQNGRLFAGSHGIHPELGHTKIVPDGRPCFCGGRGCLDAYASIWGIVGQAAELRGQEVPHWSVMHGALVALLAESRSGDEAITEIFRRAGTYLGIALANHVNVQDPDRITVLNPVPGFVEHIEDRIRQSLHDNTLRALRGRALLEFKPLDERLRQRGSAAMVAEQLYLGR